MKMSILLICIFLSIKASTQVVTISQTEIDKYKNDKAGYKNNKEEYYGARHMVDAYNIIVSFKQILFDKRAKKLTIKGTTHAIILDSSSRLEGTRIFLARPKRDKLEDTQVIGYSSTSDSGVKRYGDFDITFQVKKNNNLYFMEGRNYYLLEYKIWDLVSNIR